MDWFTFLIAGVPILLLAMVLAIWIMGLFSTKKKAANAVRQFVLHHGGKELPGPTFGLTKTERDDFFQKRLGEKINWSSVNKSPSILIRGAWKKDSTNYFCTLYMYWSPTTVGTAPSVELVMSSDTGKDVEYPNLFGVVPSQEKMSALFEQLLKA